jgi:hypothetical protein
MASNVDTLRDFPSLVTLTGAFNVALTSDFKLRTPPGRRRLHQQAIAA